ncbi:protein of unknown function [Cupriavidus taiwanensis]|nr:protein of unknown function [Cupriavidus taiwanensis]
MASGKRALRWRAAPAAAPRLRAAGVRYASLRSFVLRAHCSTMAGGPGTAVTTRIKPATDAGQCASLCRQRCFSSPR